MDFDSWLAERKERNYCWCVKCRPITLADIRTVVCPSCGDKRCVHAGNHEAPCARDDIYAHNSWVERNLILSPATPRTEALAAQPLTDEQIDAISRRMFGVGCGGNSDREFARAILAAAQEPKPSQVAIDEIRAVFLGYHVEIELYPSGGSISVRGCEECGTDPFFYASEPWRSDRRPLADAIQRLQEQIAAQEPKP